MLLILFLQSWWFLVSFHCFWLLGKVTLLEYAFLPMWQTNFCHVCMLVPTKDQVVKRNTVGNFFLMNADICQMMLPLGLNSKYFNMIIYVSLCWFMFTETNHIFVVVLCYVILFDVHLSHSKGHLRSGLANWKQMIISFKIPFKCMLA